MDEQERNNRLSQIETAWTLVVRAHGTADNAAAEAQQALIERYLGAIYRYLFGAVRDEDVAQELFQEFAIRFLRRISPCGSGAGAISQPAQDGADQPGQRSL